MLLSFWPEKQMKYTDNLLRHVLKKNLKRLAIMQEELLKFPLEVDDDTVVNLVTIKNEKC